MKLSKIQSKTANKNIQRIVKSTVQTVRATTGELNLTGGDTDFIIRPPLASNKLINPI